MITFHNNIVRLLVEISYDAYYTTRVYTVYCCKAAIAYAVRPLKQILSELDRVSYKDKFGARISPCYYSNAII